MPMTAGLYSLYGRRNCGCYWRFGERFGDMMRGMSG